MIEINQEMLCDFCRDYHDNNMDRCEGSHCERMTELYLEENGITEDNPEVKTFRKVRVNDKIYRLIDIDNLPMIEEYNIISINITSDKKLFLMFGPHGMTIENKDTNTQEDVFLIKKDAEKALEAICIERIVQLSKIIGKLGRGVSDGI